LDGVGRMKVDRRGFGRTWFGTCNLGVGKSGGRRAEVGERRLWRWGFGTCNLGRHRAVTGGLERAEVGDRRLRRPGFGDRGNGLDVVGRMRVGRRGSGRTWFGGRSEDVVRRTFGGRGSEDVFRMTWFGGRGSEDGGLEDKGLEDEGWEDRVERLGCRGEGWEYAS
jgi:hypothetical protein